jgi:hypothetical protein
MGSADNLLGVHSQYSGEGPKPKIGLDGRSACEKDT